LTSKIHLAVDGRGLPMSVILTPGQAGDNPQLLPLLDQINVGRAGRGRPRKRPERVLAYSHPCTRTALRRRGIRFTSPERIDQIERRRAKGSHGGRPPAFDQAVYADRNVVERCFNRLKQFRALATRYAKRVAYYRSEIIIAAIVLWLRADRTRLSPGDSRRPQLTFWWRWHGAFRLRACVIVRPAVLPGAPPFVETEGGFSQPGRARRAGV
jgi:transposase